MEVIVDSLQSEVDKLCRLLEDYEANYLNLYHILASSSLFWQDPHAARFFNNVDFEKIKVKSSIEELTSIKNVYEYLLTKYKSLGNKFSFKLENYESVLSKIDQYINEMQVIITCYNNLNLDFCGNEVSDLYSQKNKLVNMVNKASQVKEKTKKVFVEIQSIENEVNLRLSKIKIELLKETDIDNFM